MKRDVLLVVVLFLLTVGAFIIVPDNSTKQPEPSIVVSSQETEAVYLPSVINPAQYAMEELAPIENLGGLSIDYVENISFDAVATKTFVEQIVQGSGVFEAGSRGTVLSQVAEGDVFIPELGAVGPPCVPGYAATLTGYDWYAHSQHPAVDIACTPWEVDDGVLGFVAAAPFDCTVMAILSEEWEANSYFSSGITVICQAGDYFAGFGHLDVEGLKVTEAGQTLSAGEPIGTISTRRKEDGVWVGTTGNTTGPHIHYFMGQKTGGGQFVYINPHDMEAFGTREAGISSTPPVVFGGLPSDFATAHVSLEELPFVTLKGDSQMLVVAGQPPTASSILVRSSLCKEESIVENIKTVYRAFRAAVPNVSVRTFLSLILTESGFRNFTDKGNGCELLQNYGGAPAYGMTQIYEPSGPTHPEIDKDKLVDTVYAAEQGARIYAEFYASSGGDEVLAAACYKGFCSSAYPSPKDATLFVNNFMGAYQQDGFWVESSEGEFWIPFDEASLLQVLGL